MVDTPTVLVITVLTLAAFAALGIWYSRGRVRTAEDYLLARSTTRRGATAATLVASVMGGWILFSPAEAGVLFGVSAIVGYGLGSAVAMLAYVVLAPRIRRLIPKGHTLSEYAHVRYGGAMFVLVFLVSLFYMFMFLATNMTAISGALALMADVPLWQSAGLLGFFVLLYTAYGGLKASIFTDTVQTLMILPLLALGYLACLHFLGGAREVHRTAMAHNPDLLDLAHAPGILFGITLVVAILAAELLNQSWWQRTYAARDERTLRRSFGIAALAVFPMVVLGGLFGVAAAGLGVVEPGQESIAFFSLLRHAVPDGVVLLIVLLAILLVMSTSDTLFSAIASLVTADLPRLTDRIDPDRLKTVARGVTVAAALGATLIAAQGYSVLALFLVADLVAAAVAFPLLAGLWLRNVGQGGALAGAGAGLLVGFTWFPITRPALAQVPGLDAILPAPDFLAAFAGAALVSAAVTWGVSLTGRRPYDLGRLAREIRGLEPAAPVPDASPNEGGA